MSTSIAEPAPLDTFVLAAHGLTKIYGNGEACVHALRGVDLTVARGEFIVLLGASGSGKSTLLNILGGLDVATAGELRFPTRRSVAPVKPAHGLSPATTWASCSSSTT